MQHVQRLVARKKFCGMLSFDFFGWTDCLHISLLDQYKKRLVWTFPFMVNDYVTIRVCVQI